MRVRYLSLDQKSETISTNDAAHRVPKQKVISLAEGGALPVGYRKGLNRFTVK